MKKILTVFLVALSSLSVKSQLNFTITNITGSSTITCLTPSINLMLSSNYSLQPVNFSWSGPANITGTNVFVNTAGTYTVYAVAPNSVSASQVISIAVNTAVPVSALTPTSQIISCINTVADVTLSAISPSVNVTHNVASPLGGTFLAQSASFVYQGPGVGTYTYCLVNNENGCSTCKQFSISSNSGFPTYSLLSTPAGFTLGCNTKSTSLINIVNANTMPMGGPLSYTILTPGTSSVTQPGSLSIISTYTFVTPGTYTAITRDNITFCETRIPFSILSNTFAPPISHVSIPRNILDCNIPMVKIEGFSAITNVNYVWSFPGNPGSINQSSINVSANPVSPTNTLIANYTLTITDNNNTCKSSTIIPMFQNLFPPIAMISSGGQTTIPCSGTLSLFNQSSSGIPQNIPPIPPPVLPVIGYEWHGPANQPSASVSSTYGAAAPGAYTMIAKDLNNGCTSSAVIIISLNAPIFSLTSAPVGFTLGCNSKSITAISVNSFSVPPGSAFSYTLLPPGSSSVLPSGTLSSNNVFSVTLAGSYTYVVRDNANSCDARVPFSVLSNTVPPSIDSVIIPTNILDCSNPTTTLLGVSSTPSISYVWLYPGLPPSIPNNPITISSQPSNPTATLIANYTLTITDNNNMCRSTTVVPMYQNLFPPVATILSSPTSTVSCAAPVQLANGSSSGIPSNNAVIPPPTLPVIAYQWLAPAPQASASISSTFLASASGVYTMIAKDLNNGCTSATVISLTGFNTYPQVSSPGSAFNLCESSQIAISPIIMGDPSGFTYSWLTPASATSVSGVGTPTLTTNGAGVYTITVTNSQSCSTTIQLTVGICVGVKEKEAQATQASIFPNPTSGIFTIILSNKETEAVMEIYNAVGVLVKLQTLPSHRTELDIKDLAQGVYVIKITSDVRPLYFARIIKQ
jgi:hypothetical protein